MNTEVLVPASGLDLAAPAPYVLQSCVLAPPAPPPGPDPEEAIYAPVPPGVDYASLPVLDTVTQLIDTSPDQIIGCANDLPAGGEQQTLDALFPAAIDGDGVVNRTNNDIWVYDGSEWNNVGPTPGPQVVVTSVLPPWNEIAIYDARIRTRLQAQSLAYALQLLTEPDPITTRTGLTVRPVVLIGTPAVELDLTAELPEVTILSVEPVSVTVTPFSYTGTGTSQFISLPITPGLVFLQAFDDLVFGGTGSAAYDSLRGSGKRWAMSGSGQEVTQAQSVTSFNARGFTVGTALQTNQSDIVFGGHAFAALGSPASNTSGTITSSVAASRTYTALTYTGNGTADATVGHGLPATPQFIIIKRLSGGTAPAVVGGPIVGDDHYMELWDSDDRLSNTARIRSTSSTTFTIGTNTGVNASGSNYVAYAFIDVPGVSKLGTYVGDGEAAGQFIDCGFDVDFLMVKGRDGGTISDTSEWLLFDRTDTARTRVYPMADDKPRTNPTAYYELQATGFLAAGDDTNVNLNNNGATYIYMAFARMLPTAEPEVVDVTVSAETPTVSVS